VSGYTDCSERLRRIRRHDLRRFGLRRLHQRAGALGGFGGALRESLDFSVLGMVCVFVPPRPGRYVYAIEAWTDEFATWRRGFELKQKAGIDLPLDAIEGAGMLTKAQAGGQAGECALC
jgi:hypothetical protein